MASADNDPAAMTDSAKLDFILAQFEIVVSRLDDHEARITTVEIAQERHDALPVIRAAAVQSPSTSSSPPPPTTPSACHRSSFTDAICMSLGDVMPASSSTPIAAMHLGVLAAASICKAVLVGASRTGQPDVWPFVPERPQGGSQGIDAWLNSVSSSPAWLNSVSSLQVTLACQRTGSRADPAEINVLVAANSACRQDAELDGGHDFSIIAASDIEPLPLCSSMPRALSSPLTMLAHSMIESLWRAPALSSTKKIEAFPWEPGGTTRACIHDGTSYMSDTCHFVCEKIQKINPDMLHPDTNLFTFGTTKCMASKFFGRDQINLHANRGANQGNKESPILESRISFLFPSLPSKILQREPELPIFFRHACLFPFGNNVTTSLGYGLQGESATRPQDYSRLRPRRARLRTLEWGNRCRGLLLPGIGRQKLITMHLGDNSSLIKGGHTYAGLSSILNCGFCTNNDGVIDTSNVDAIATVGQLEDELSSGSGVVLWGLDCGSRTVLWPCGKVETIHYGKAAAAGTWKGSNCVATVGQLEGAVFREWCNVVA